MSFVPVRFYNMPLQDECVPWHQGDFFSGVVVQETMSEIIAPKPTIDKVCFFMLSLFWHINFNRDLFLFQLIMAKGILCVKSAGEFQKGKRILKMVLHFVRSVA